MTSESYTRCLGGGHWFRTGYHSRCVSPAASTMAVRKAEAAIAFGEDLNGVHSMEGGVDSSRDRAA